MQSSNDLALGPRRNRLLASLPDAAWANWQPLLESVELRAGQILHESACIPACAYFPTTATVSLLNMMPNGAVSEMALVGNEGMIGIALFMGQHTETSQAVVQGSGYGYRLCRRALRSDMARDPSLISMLFYYANSMVARMMQTAMCNLYHSVEQRLCRRLLVSVDRSPTGGLALTHQNLANLLGVRRESVSAVAQVLQRADAIRYRRGNITVLDRGILERRTCDCYLTASTDYYRQPVGPARARVHGEPTFRSSLGFDRNKEFPRSISAVR